MVSCVGEMRGGGVGRVLAFEKKQDKLLDQALAVSLWSTLAMCIFLTQWFCKNNKGCRRL